MDASPVIRKIAPPYPGMDFWRLRREGIDRIIALSGDLWTDFNIHDPGITFLEVLCYAVSDLAYRTNLPLEDLLAQQSGEVPPPGLPAAPEVLTCNPVTTMDWRKRLIDIEGIKNAWVFKDLNPQPAFGYLIGADGKPKFDVNDNPTIIFNSDDPIGLNGLLQILIDFDDDITGNPRAKAAAREAAYNVFHAHRNLCEDCTGLYEITTEYIGICAAVEIDEESDPNEIYAEIAWRIQDFLTPTPHWYGLEEMLQRKGTRSYDDIFSGPLLENGFLDSANLLETELKKRINISDLYRIICDIPGVKKVWGLKANTASAPAWDENRINIPDRKKPVLHLPASNIALKRRGTEVVVEQDTTIEMLERLQMMRRPLSARDRLRIPYPNAQLRPDLTEYFSIQNDLPHTYRVDYAGLEDNQPAALHAQVRQLKGFLLLFDQILANYLVQLAAVKNLLSVNQDIQAPVLSGMPLYEQVPNIGQVLTGFDPATGKSEAYDNFLKTGLISDEENLRQRNVLLDHLLARFAESFSDFAIATYFNDPRTAWTKEDYLVRLSRNITEKADLLRQTPHLSRIRGKSFNYCQEQPDGSPDIWETSNVEGLKLRVCAQLGIKPALRGTLTCPPAFEVEPFRLKNKYGFYFRDKNTGETLLVSEMQTTEARIATALTDLMNVVVQLENYEIDWVKWMTDNLIAKGEKLSELHEEIRVLLAGTDFSVEKATGNAWQLCVTDSHKRFIARSYVRLQKVGDLTDFLDGLKSVAVSAECSSEGFHIVEHILLRPQKEGCCEDHPAIKIEKPDEKKPDEMVLLPDPYSFWITVVVPNQWKRFKHESNRKVFEQTVRMETPAQIGVRICWVDQEDLYHFETAYGRWLTEFATPNQDRCDLDEYAKILITLLNKYDGTACCDDMADIPDLSC